MDCEAWVKREGFKEGLSSKSDRIMRIESSSWGRSSVPKPDPFQVSKFGMR